MKKLPLSLFFAAATLCAAAAPVTYNASDSAAVRFSGRTLATPDGDVSFDWSGVYAETVLDGKALRLRVSDTGESYYDLFIDGKKAGKFNVNSADTTITIAEKLPRGRHTIEIKKRTEGEHSTATFHEFILPAGGSLTATAPRSRHIEIIGNSLTAGYGTEGLDRNEPFKISTENCNLSYSTIVPRYFDADYTLIAHSGQGANRNYGDSVRTSAVSMRQRIMQTFDKDTASAWDFSIRKPDLVIINLGANDFSTEPHPYRSEFVKSYTEILTKLLDKYGKEQNILCLMPYAVSAPVESYYTEAIANAGGKNIHFLRMPVDLINTTSDLGSSWHPNYTGQKKMSMFLIPYISTITGWPLTDKTVE